MPFQLFQNLTINGTIFDSTTIKVKTSEGLTLQPTRLDYSQNIERSHPHVLGSAVVAGGTPGVFLPGEGEIELLLGQWMAWYKAITKTGAVDGLRIHTSNLTITYFSKEMIPVEKIHLGKLYIDGRSFNASATNREAISVVVPFTFELMTETGVLGRAAQTGLNAVNRIV